jgi:Ni/Co efflux regulator RcnB
MKKTITCLIAASCFALSANLAHAEGGQGMEAGHNDGTTHLDRRFQAADANHDGGLDREEAKNMPMLSRYFDEVDANKDGKVTRQEYFDAMPLLHGVKKIDTSAKPQSM